MAEITPRGSAISTAVTVAMIAICSDNWNRRPISWVIGLVVHIDFPKSKVA